MQENKRRPRQRQGGKDNALFYRSKQGSAGGIGTSSLKTLSNIMTFVGVIFWAIFQMVLLSFINAPMMLWGLWGIALVASMLVSIMALLARDEYYAEQYAAVIEKAIENVKKREASA